MRTWSWRASSPHTTTTRTRHRRDERNDDGRVRGHPLHELRLALRGRTSLLVIDGIDAIPAGAERDRAAAMLRDAASTTVLASAVDPVGAQGFFAEAGRASAPVLDVSRSSVPTPAEVSA